MWDPEQRTQNVVLRDQELTAVQINNENGTVVGLPPCPLPSPGCDKFYFEVRINLVRGGICIGIVDDTFSTSRIKGSATIGDFAGTWAMDSFTGSVGTSGKWKPYAKKLKVNSIVGVLIDLENYTLSFSVNGENFGVAFNLPKDKQFYPAVAVKYKETSVSGIFGDMHSPNFTFKPPNFLPITCLPTDMLNEQQKKSLEVENYNAINSPIYSIAEEVVMRILSHLNAHDLGSALKTCKLFNRVGSDNRVWRTVLKKEFKINPTEKPASRSFKSRCKTRSNWFAGKYSQKVEHFVKETVRCMDINDKYLVAGCDNDLILYSLLKGDDSDELGRFVGHTWYVTCVQMDDERIISGGSDFKIKVWGIESGLLQQTLRGDSEVRCIHFPTSTKNQKLVSGSKNVITLWDIETGDSEQTLSEHTQAVNSLYYCLENQLIFSASKDKLVKLWDPKSGTCINTFNEHAASVNCLAFDPVKQHLFTGSADRTVKMFDLRKNIGQWTYKHVSVNCMKLNEGVLVSGNTQGTLDVWQAGQNQPCYSMQVPAYSCVAFNETQLRVGCAHKIKLYDFEDFDEQCNYEFRRANLLSRIKKNSIHL